LKNKIYLIGASSGIGMATYHEAKVRQLNVVPTYRFNPIEGGICYTLENDSPSIFNLHENDVVVIFAACSDQSWVRMNRNNSRQVNVVATKKIIFEALLKKAKVVYVSSEAVFGEKNLNGWLENDRPCPVTEFGKQKYEIEKLLNSVKMSTIIRTGWNVWDFISNRCIIQNIYEGLLTKKIKIAKDNIFSLTNIYDTANLILDTIQNEFFGIIHSVSGIPISRKELADSIMTKSMYKKEMGYLSINYDDLDLLEPKS